jgi:hypothetical protein
MRVMRGVRVTMLGRSRGYDGYKVASLRGSQGLQLRWLQSGGKGGW